MISRIWHGWASPANADAYEAFLRDESLPRIRAKGIPGFHGIQLLRLEGPEEVEFVTEMWFDSLEHVKGYAGEDYTVAAVLPKAQALLSRYDRQVKHYTISIGKDV